MFAVTGSLIYRLPAVDSLRMHLLGPAMPFFRVISIAQDAAVRIVRGEAALDLDAHTASSAISAAWSSARLANLENEVNELRSFVGADPVVAERSVAAMVTANPSLSGGRTMLIDKGAEHGLVEGGVVVTPAYGSAAVVGRIESVSGSFSRVRTILDPSVRIAARTRGSTGHVYVGNSDRWGGRLEYVSHDRVIMVGDTVTTSADGTLFPEGLVLGRVVRASSGPGVFQEVEVEPAAPIASLRYVQVVVVSSSTGIAREAALGRMRGDTAESAPPLESLAISLQDSPPLQDGGAR
jgi:rod shape-determining protein MreC